jgi:predicted nucleotidyltransferase component of viral defense system
VRYETAAAFRRALSDHLNNRARREGVPVSRLQRQVTFERFLARLFRGDDQRWVLKGGYALELRLSGIARATRDLDLNVPPPAAPDLLDELQGAVELDMGDFFEFTVSAPSSRGHLAGPPMGGYRFSVEARLDGRRFDRFPLDVGQGDVTVREPDRVRGQVDLTFAGLATPVFAVYPLEDHFAEKLHAYTTPREHPSRVKDLVDMLLLIEFGLGATDLLRSSIEATFDRYARHALPDVLPTPPPGWQEAFVQLAAEVALPERDLDEAYLRLQAFLASRAG